ncbi:MAG: hypothetical protein RLZ57_1121 [Actinomycetota bacterium]
MSELRITGRSEDGTHLLLVDANDQEFTLRISDHLRSQVNQPRLAAVRVEEHEGISVKEVQAKLRAGQSFELVAAEANWPIDKVERFAGPILQERAYIIDLAHKVVIKKDGSREPITFLDVVVAKLATNNVSVDSLEWNTHRREDGTWVISLNYPNRDGHGSAEWIFDQGRRTLVSQDDSADWLLGNKDKKFEQPASNAITHGLVTSTPTQPVIEINTAPTPRLQVIKEVEDASDGVTKRASIPSWDEIMFGKKSDE